MILTTAAAGFAASAGLIMAIGAQNAFVLRQGLQQMHVGVVVAICATSDLALILLGVGGMGALVEHAPWLLQALRVGGAAFLGAYALMAGWRAWRGTSGLSVGDGRQHAWYKAALACLAFTFLNPHVYLDTMILLGSLSTAYAGSLRWVFAAGACAASITWFLALGYGARLLTPVFRNPTAWRVMDASIALFMLALCITLLVRPFS
ncbi:amino acid transporter [Luteibacter pinisoli]|uniref:Amino acid transporter n=1 Tax=Luteibacter pinisoli TaxID=2589080 RepID=A0A4Y5Z1Q4_9GAMM|nr:LysE/ArgO family amino acid transporter [Luteibacter pinisoli]QDE38418.1 amino acid transporter [Luteibacter pinisoli]